MTVEPADWREARRVYGGSSGSPVIDRSSGQVLAVVNTTTAGSAPGADCLIHRPCEVANRTWQVQENTDYVMPVWRLERCFDQAGTFTLGAGCQLDPGTGATTAGTPMVANPAAPAFADRPVASTWQTAVAGARVAAYRTRTGPLGSTDCADESKYGPSISLAAAPVVNDPLPTQPGLYALCILASAADGLALQAP